MKLYCCSVCGKWSHAQKKPVSHKAWVKPGNMRYDPAKNENEYSDEEAHWGHFVDCGPFETWIAMPESEFHTMIDDYIRMM